MGEDLAERPNVFLRNPVFPKKIGNALCAIKSPTLLPHAENAEAVSSARTVQLQCTSSIACSILLLNGRYVM